MDDDFMRIFINFFLGTEFPLFSEFEFKMSISYDYTIAANLNVKIPNFACSQMSIIGRIVGMRQKSKITIKELNFYASSSKHETKLSA